MNVDWLDSTGTGWLWMLGGVVLSIAAGYAKQYIEAKFGIRHDFFRERTREKAIKEIETAWSYKSGKRDIYLESIITATTCIGALIFTMGLIGGAATIRIRADIESIHERSTAATVGEIGYTISAVFLACLSLALYRMLLRKISVYEHFDMHKEEVEERFKITLDLDPMGDAKPSDPAA